MNKTDEELNQAEKMAKLYGVRMCDENGDTHGEELYCVGIDDIADIIREALAEQDHFAASGKPIAEPEYYDCGGTIGVVHKSQCSAAMKRNGKPWKCACGANLYIDSNGAPASKAEPVKQEPVAHYKDAPHTIYLQTGCDDPEDCECSFNEWGDTTWCADQIHDTDIPYIRADYAAPVSVEAAVLAERETCAAICDRFAERDMQPAECAAAIRARGEK